MQKNNLLLVHPQPYLRVLFVYCWWPTCSVSALWRAALPLSV